MTGLDGYRMRLVCVGFIAVVAFLQSRATAEIITSEPVNVGPVINDERDMQECDFSHDGLELYFSATNRPGGYGRNDIWVSKRDTLDSPWQEPVNLGPNVNGAKGEIEPSISGDGLELYFRYGGEYFLRVCKRPSKDAPWSSPVKIGPPVASLEEDMPIGSDDAYTPDISADGLSLYFASTRAGGRGGEDIWVTTRATKSDPWTEPVNLGPKVNSSANHWSPSISTDGLTLLFHQGTLATWATTRRSKDDDWGAPVNLGISKDGSHGWQHGVALAPDGSYLYVENYKSQWGGYGNGDLWKVEFTPIVDFNGDEAVDAADMLIFTDNLYTHRTLCDIAPLPLGDGYIDAKDLRVLAEHLDPGDPSLIAHWPLDETEGDVAYDGAGYSDGIVTGACTWQPAGGCMEGALAFDGTTAIVADHVLNPSDGPFSVLAWIKGGAPGQVIISQADGANWLVIDAVTGTLATELVAPAGRFTVSPLVSDTILTDDTWHRIAFTWDGALRTLYVDDMVVAADVQDSLAGCSGDLIIGCGADQSPGSSFYGLIDDVRIYNRAVRP